MDKYQIKKFQIYSQFQGYTIASEENLYSIFTLECLSNNVKVIINKKIKIKNFKKSFIKIDYSSKDLLKNLKKL